MILIRNSISILSMPVCFLSYSRSFTCWIWMDMVKFTAQRSNGNFTHILTSFQGFWRFDNLRHLFLPGFLAPVGVQNLQSVTFFTSNPPNFGIKTKRDTLFQSDVILFLSNLGVNLPLFLYNVKGFMVYGGAPWTQGDCDKNGVFFGNSQLDITPKRWMFNGGILYR